MKGRLRVKNYFVDLSLVVLSISLSLCVGEGISRVVLDPIDYLMPEIVGDGILGYRIEPNSSGHDAWGYRNQSVPDTVDIVAIGDSQTYGVSATASDSWPAQLQRLAGKKVYNLSLGGYGPVQYYYLLENKALQLNPSWVIVGFYYGNDLLDTYQAVYNNDYWSHLRNPQFTPEQSVGSSEMGPDRQAPQGTFAGIRGWLAHHSMLYRVVTQTAFGDIVRSAEMKACAQTESDCASIEDEEHNVYAGFTPQTRLRALDLGDAKVQEGLHVSLDLFAEMRELCREKDIHFLVVLIPTKESVFSEYVEHNIAINNSAVIDELIANERQVNGMVQAYFTEHHIAYVDVLSALSNAVGKESIYPSNQGGHPTKSGYEIISRSIQQYYLENEEEAWFALD